ncbi:MAG: NHLP family bacteriocin export ABC transporter peptidase/permease/ATPase subunit [Pseudomonadota bacterium]
MTKFPKLHPVSQIKRFLLKTAKSVGILLGVASSRCGSWFWRPNKTPVILQIEMSDSGAACLAIILAYYGKYISLEEARDVSGISRNGGEAINVLLAARYYGLDAQGIQVQDIKSVEKIKEPCIAFWEFNHYVIVEHICKDKVYINDPALGPRALSLDDFSHSFTGIIISLKPGKKFKKGGLPLSTFKMLKQRIAHQKIPLTFICLTTIALALPGIITPGFSKIFVDNVLIGGIEEWFVPLALVILGATLLEASLTWVQQIHLLRLHLQVMASQSCRLLWHIIHLPMAFFSQRYAGDIQTYMLANYKIASILSGQLSSSIANISVLFALVLVMLLLNIHLTVVVVTIGILNMLLLFIIAEKIRYMNQLFLQEQGELTGLIMNGIHIIETLKATVTEDQCFLKWVGMHAQTINAQQKIYFYNQALVIMPTLFSGITTVTVLCWGSWKIMHGDLTIGTLLAFQMLSKRFHAPVATLVGMSGSIQKIRGDLLRLTDILHQPLDKQVVETSSVPVPYPLRKLTGEITLRQINFGYKKLEAPFIKDFNVQIEPGQHVAIVGASGSGKSTIAKLITGLYAPWSGEILFDGQPMNTISREVLVNSLSLVDRENHIYEGTLRDNLTLWDPKVPEKDIHKALKLACIEEEVYTHGKLEKLMLENGANYSGGQRQCLEIARALITHPRILILDEATTALDTLKEKQIFQNLKAINCTLVIIAHRISTIRNCDNILVIDQGSILEQGTHEQLIKKKGAYKKMQNLEMEL